MKLLKIDNNIEFSTEDLPQLGSFLYHTFNKYMFMIECFLDLLNKKKFEKSGN